MLINMASNSTCIWGSGKLISDIWWPSWLSKQTFTYFYEPPINDKPSVTKLETVLSSLHLATCKILLKIFWCEQRLLVLVSVTITTALSFSLGIRLQPMNTQVPACHVTTCYYVGFAYMMVRRYQDAIRTFSNILLFIQRTKQHFQSRTYLYDQVRHSVLQ